MITPEDLSYKVRVWKIRTFTGKRGKTYRVRWKVESEEFGESFDNKAQADAFRSQLVQAQSRSEAFSLSQGLPVSMLRTQRPTKSWYEFACSYVDHVWPDISAHHRQNIAWALMRATSALFTTERGKPDDALLRKALRRWAFNATKRRAHPWPHEIQAALSWAQAHTRDVAELAEPKVIQGTVKAATTKLDGTRCALKSRRRNHSVLKAALDFAVEEGLLATNPTPTLEGSTGRTIHQVDRRCVPNPTQARALLEAVRGYGHHSEKNGDTHQSGPRLVAFFATMYYAALRPEEAINLHKHNLSLAPPTVDDNGETSYDWGELHLERSTPEVGREWTDSGQARDDRPLKQREDGEGRIVPCPPELTQLLWEHLQAFGTDEEGRLFRGVRGGPLPTTTYRRAWRHARKTALTEVEHRSPLARRPYDLRHACVSTWLNAGVSETLVARWAGHSVAVLKKVYAKCLVGEEERAKKQIEDVLNA